MPGALASLHGITVPVRLKGLPLRLRREAFDLLDGLEIPEALGRPQAFPYPEILL
jgi:hypothetical protein